MPPVLYGIPLPPKDTDIPLEDVITICVANGMDYEAEILRTDPPEKPFRTDYVSCFPDVVKLYGQNSIDLRWPAVLHDISYFCGYRGNAARRLVADSKLQIDVIVISGGTKHLAEFTYGIVRSCGFIHGTGYHYSYGRG